MDIENIQLSFCISELKKLFEAFEASGIQMNDFNTSLEDAMLLVENSGGMQSYRFLEDTVVGEKIYDINCLSLCKAHKEIVRFEFETNLCGVYEECCCCNWLTKGRKLPIKKRILVRGQLKSRVFTKQEFQDIILYIDDIIDDVPEAVIHLSTILATNDYGVRKS